MNSVLDVVVGCLSLAAFPLIFFVLVIPGIRISMWAGEKASSGKGFCEVDWVGWIVYMVGSFWSLMVGIGACALYGYWMTRLLG